MKHFKKHFVICVENGDYRASLEKRKIYLALPQEPNDPDSMIRVIDESGEDYLFPNKWFVAVELPPKARRAMAAAS
jgi:hypothetical protein